MFTVGFLGDADVTEDNALELLDSYFLPEYNLDEFCLLMPKDIKRTQSGLRAVLGALTSSPPSGLGLEVRREAENDILDAMILEHAQGNPEVFLVVLVNEAEGASDELFAMIEKAADAGIKIKNLAAAMDDVEIDNTPDQPEEPAVISTLGDVGEPNEARQYGQPRTTEPQVAETIVEGSPAIVGQEPTAAMLLEQAIRVIIKEELMALSIGHNTRQTDMHPQDVAVKEAGDTVRVFQDEKGDYTLAPEEVKRAPKGSKTVQLSTADAQKAGLVS